MILLIIILLTGLVWGISEGITMIQFYDRNYKKTWLDKWNAGARSHRWFGYYHLIDGVAFGGAIVIGWFLAKNIPSWTFLIGVGLLGWQAKETGCAFSRWKQLIAFQENINFFDTFKWQLSTTISYISAITKLIIGIILIIVSKEI